MRTDFITFILLWSLVYFFYIIKITEKRKTGRLSDYYLKSKFYSVLTLLSVLLFTWLTLGCSAIFMYEIFIEGLWYFIASLGEELSLIIAACFLLPKMSKLISKISIADMMGSIYGDKVKILTSVFSTIAACGLIAVNFRICANFFSNGDVFILHVFIVSAGLIITLSSMSVGCVRTIVFMEILLLVFAFCILFFFVYKFFYTFYGEDCLINNIVQHPAYDIKTILDFNNPNFSRLLALFCYFSIPIITDPAVHRVIVAKDYKQTRKALLLTALCLVVVKLSIVAGVLWMSVSCEPIKSISLFSFVLHSRIPDIWWLVLHIFTSRTFNRMNVVTLLLVEDNRSLFHRLNLKISSISRFVAFVVGAISITLALSECDLLELVIIAHSFYYTTIMPVFLLTIFGLRFTKERVLTAIITAFLCVVIWQQFGVVFNCISINLSSILLGIMANLIILLCPDIFAKPFLTKISLNQKN